MSVLELLHIGQGENTSRIVLLCSLCTPCIVWCDVMSCAWWWWWVLLNMLYRMIDVLLNNSVEIRLVYVCGLFWSLLSEVQLLTLIAMIHFFKTTTCQPIERDKTGNMSSWNFQGQMQTFLLLFLYRLQKFYVPFTTRIMVKYGQMHICR